VLGPSPLGNAGSTRTDGNGTYTSQSDTALRMFMHAATLAQPDECVEPSSDGCIGAEPPQTDRRCRGGVPAIEDLAPLPHDVAEFHPRDANAEAGDSRKTRSVR
jgi:hypothetical protein